MSNIEIPVYQPYLNGNEKKYVMDCMNTTWISSKGSYITKFEDAFAKYTDSKYATTVNNGTTAIHLALLAIGIQPGDEIIVPSFTYVASVNMIVAAGAVPVFADSTLETWQISIDDVVRKITSRTKAIMAVHLYGNCCNMDILLDICNKNNLKLIEDCAEAFGTFYKNQHVGTFGDVATFSFFGNKTITTGEGGMVITQSQEIYDELIHLKNQGVSKTKQYWHDVVAYNYRMTNIQAAIGLGQIEQIEEIISKKQIIAKYYQTHLAHLPLNTDPINDEVVNSYWMSSIVLDDSFKRDDLRAHLEQLGIETRPFFYPSHVLPMYEHLAKSTYPNAEKISASGINLPSFPSLNNDQLEYICVSIKEFFHAYE